MPVITDGQSLRSVRSMAKPIAKGGMNEIYVAAQQRASGYETVAIAVPIEHSERSHREMQEIVATLRIANHHVTPIPASSWVSDDGHVFTRPGTKHRWVSIHGTSPDGCVIMEYLHRYTNAEHYARRTTAHMPSIMMAIAAQSDLAESLTYSGMHCPDRKLANMMIRSGQSGHPVMDRDGCIEVVAVDIASAVTGMMVADSRAVMGVTAVHMPARWYMAAIPAARQRGASSQVMRSMLCHADQWLTGSQIIQAYTGSGVNRVLFAELEKQGIHDKNHKISELAVLPDEIVAGPAIDETVSVMQRMHGHDIAAMGAHLLRDLMIHDDSKHLSRGEAASRITAFADAISRKSEPEIFEEKKSSQVA